MKTLVVNNQKGGVGKTMLACHLAWFLAETPGARIAFFDFDPQANASKVLKDNHDGGLAASLFAAAPFAVPEGRQGITIFRASDHLIHVQDSHIKLMTERFAALADGFDYAIIDTPPSWGSRNRAALTVADHLLSPVDLEMFAVDGVAGLRRNMAVVTKEERGGRPIHFLGLLASRYQSNSPAQKANLKQLFDSAGALMFQGVITQRQGYAQAMQEQAPVWTLKSTAQQAAGKEIRAVLATVRAKIETVSQERAA